jgi:pteridine reductase
LDLRDSVSVVTGAGRRLGRAIALDLAGAGSRIVVHYGTSAEAAEQVVRDIRALGVEAVAVPADLAHPEQIATLCERVRQEMGRLDVLVNSAARFERQSFPEVTAQDWDRTLSVNLRAPFLLTQCAAALMISSRRERPGLVVNIADLSGVQVWHGYVQHGVSKAGLLHLTRLAARELAPDVRVNAVVPGAILPPPGVGAESEAWRDLGQRLPLKRVGEPSQVAHAIRFLAENDFVTGSVIYVDGGEHLGGPRKH